MLLTTDMLTSGVSPVESKFPRRTPPSPQVTINCDKVFIVSHTHWDREWYLTRARFQTKLRGVVKEVLRYLETNEDFKHFLLDGQAIILEDYLEVEPGDEQRIRKQVERGALAIGPWYVLPDEFLISAEATIRNLVYGHDLCRQFGSPQKVGYLPDSFGHIAQLPQILVGAGIDSFVYTRGNGAEIDDLGLEYTWVAPDGSEVLAVHQYGGYCNAGGLGLRTRSESVTSRDIHPELAVEKVRELLTQMESRSNGSVYLLNNGCDHYPPQRAFSEIMSRLREAFPGTEFVHSSLTEFLRAIRAAGIASRRFQGELRQGRLHLNLPGVWSTRMYLKQLNDEAQSMLSRYVEPVCSFMQFFHGQEFPRGVIDHAWKRLLQNHPHDSICGCSTDQVHEEMVTRFRDVIESGDELIREQMERIIPSVACESASDREVAISVFNPLTESRTCVISRILILDSGDVDVGKLSLVDRNGSQVPFKVVDASFRRRVWGDDYRRQLFYDDQLASLQTIVDDLAPGGATDSAQIDGRVECFLTIEFLAEDIPALGHATYYLAREAEKPGDDTATVSVSGNVIENEYYRVDVKPNGSFDVFDKHTECLFTDLNLLEDGEDVGDEYDYSPCASPLLVTSREVTGEVKVLVDTGLSATVDVAFCLPLPISIAADRTERRGEVAQCPFHTRITLKHGSRSIEVETLFENCVKDHRLRVSFPTGIETESVLSDGHFYVNERSIRPPSPEGADWVQPPQATVPQQDFSAVQDGRRGLAILSRGLPEIEPVLDEEGAVELKLTLLRSVGWLSRDDLRTRKGAPAGPTLATPAAQCLGQYRFSYAVVPFAGDFLRDGVKGESERYRTPVVVQQGVKDQIVAGGQSLLKKVTKYSCTTSVRVHNDRNTLLVRIYNLSGNDIEETLQSDLKIVAAWRTDLLDERIAGLDSTDGVVNVSLAPYQIATLEIEFGT